MLDLVNIMVNIMLHKHPVNKFVGFSNTWNFDNLYKHIKSNTIYNRITLESTRDHFDGHITIPKIQENGSWKNAIEYELVVSVRKRNKYKFIRSSDEFFKKFKKVPNMSITKRSHLRNIEQVLNQEFRIECKKISNFKDLYGKMWCKCIDLYNDLNTEKREHMDYFNHIDTIGSTFHALDEHLDALEEQIRICVRLTNYYKNRLIALQEQNMKEFKNEYNL